MASSTHRTTIGGFLDGMGLSTITGRCWTGMAQRVPGFTAVAESNIWLLGTRDLDPLERVALESSEVNLVSAHRIGSDLAAELRRQLATSTDIYLHIDVDVLDPSQGRANGFAVSGGSTADMLRDFCGSLGTPAAATVASYDPSFDEDRRICEAAITAVDALLSTGRDQRD